MRFNVLSSVVGEVDKVWTSFMTWGRRAAPGWLQDCPNVATYVATAVGFPLPQGPAALSDFAILTPIMVGTLLATVVHYLGPDVCKFIKLCYNGLASLLKGLKMCGSFVKQVASRIGEKTSPPPQISPSPPSPSVPVVTPALLPPPAPLSFSPISTQETIPVPPAPVSSGLSIIPVVTTFEIVPTDSADEEDEEDEEDENAEVVEEEVLPCEQAGDKCHPCPTFPGEFHHRCHAHDTKSDEPQLEDVPEPAAIHAPIDQEKMDEAVEKAFETRGPRYINMIIEACKLNQAAISSTINSPEVLGAFAEAILKDFRNDPALGKLSHTGNETSNKVDKVLQHLNDINDAEEEDESSVIMLEQYRQDYITTLTSMKGRLRQLFNSVPRGSEHRPSINFFLNEVINQQRRLPILKIKSSRSRSVLDKVELAIERLQDKVAELERLILGPRRQKETDRPGHGQPSGKDSSDDDSSDYDSPPPRKAIRKPSKTNKASPSEAQEASKSKPASISRKQSTAQDMTVAVDSQGATPAVGPSEPADSRGNAPVPVVQEPVVQKPAAQKPAAQTPVIKTPKPQQPESVAQKPVIQKPFIQKPVVQKPATQTPELQQPEPVTQKSAAPTPEPQQPVAQQPKPVARKPRITLRLPVAQVPVAHELAAQTPVVQTPKPQQPKPVAQVPVSPKPVAQTPVVQTPEPQQPKPVSQKPLVHKPKPVARKPKIILRLPVAQPSPVVAPKVTVPDVAAPEPNTPAPAIPEACSSLTAAADKFVRDPLHPLPDGLSHCGEKTGSKDLWREQAKDRGDSSNEEDSDGASDTDHCLRQVPRDHTPDSPPVTPEAVDSLADSFDRLTEAFIEGPNDAIETEKADEGSLPVPPVVQSGSSGETSGGAQEPKNVGVHGSQQVNEPKNVSSPKPEQGKASELDNVNAPKSKNVNTSQGYTVPTFPNATAAEYASEQIIPDDDSDIKSGIDDLEDEELTKMEADAASPPNIAATNATAAVDASAPITPDNDSSTLSEISDLNGEDLATINAYVAANPHVFAPEEQHPGATLPAATHQQSDGHDEESRAGEASGAGYAIPIFDPPDGHNISDCSPSQLYDPTYDEANDPMAEDDAYDPTRPFDVFQPSPIYGSINSTSNEPAPSVWTPATFEEQNQSPPIQPDDSWQEDSDMSDVPPASDPQTFGNGNIGPPCNVGGMDDPLAHPANNDMDVDCVPVVDPNLDIQMEDAEHIRLRQILDNLKTPYAPFHVSPMPPQPLDEDMDGVECQPAQMEEDHPMKIDWQATPMPPPGTPAGDENMNDTPAPAWGVFNQQGYVPAATTSSAYAPVSDTVTPAVGEANAPATTPWINPSPIYQPSIGDIVALPTVQAIASAIPPSGIRYDDLLSMFGVPRELEDKFHEIFQQVAGMAWNDELQFTWACRFPSDREIWAAIPEHGITMQQLLSKFPYMVSIADAGQCNQFGTAVMRHAYQFFVDQLWYPSDWKVSEEEEVAQPVTDRSSHQAGNSVPQEYAAIMVTDPPRPPPTSFFPSKKEVLMAIPIGGITITKLWGDVFGTTRVPKDRLDDLRELVREVTVLVKPKGADRVPRRDLMLSMLEWRENRFNFPSGKLPPHEEPYQSGNMCWNPLCRAVERHYCSRDSKDKRPAAPLGLQRAMAGSVENAPGTAGVAPSGSSGIPGLDNYQVPTAEPYQHQPVVDFGSKTYFAAGTYSKKDQNHFFGAGPSSAPVAQPSQSSNPVLPSPSRGGVNYHVNSFNIPPRSTQPTIPTIGMQDGDPSGDEDEQKRKVKGKARAPVPITGPSTVPAFGPQALTPPSTSFPTPDEVFYSIPPNRGIRYIDLLAKLNNQFAGDTAALFRAVKMVGVSHGQTYFRSPSYNPAGVPTWCLNPECQSIDHCDCPAPSEGER